MASVFMIFGMFLNLTPDIYAIDHPDPFQKITVACKVRVYFGQSTVMMYRWCMVAACFDRHACVSTNARLRNFSQVGVVYRTIAMIMIIWLLLPVHILIFYEVISGRCGANNISVALYHGIYTIITGNLLPVLAMLGCAIFIRRNLILRRERRRQLQTDEKNNNEHAQRTRDRQVFAMLLLQAIVYFITQTPWMIFLFYNAATIYVSNKSADRLAIERFVSAMCNTILYIFPSSSFFLYILASRTFREGLMTLLHFRVIRRFENTTNRVIPLEHHVFDRNYSRPVDTYAASGLPAISRNN